MSEAITQVVKDRYGSVAASGLSSAHEGVRAVAEAFGYSPEELASIPAELVLDCADLRCPLPVIELARHLGDVPVGSVVAVGTRDVAARTDVPAWCRMRGQDYLGERPDDRGVPQHLVRRRT